MDPFEQFPELPDLTGQVTTLSYQPVHSGAYSRIYRGRLRQNGSVVCSSKP